MNENNDLFPFPPGPEDERPAESALPAFPGEVEPEFSADERRALRKMLQVFGDKKGEKAGDEAAVILPVEPPLPLATTEDVFATAWNSLEVTDPSEIEALSSFKELFAEIPANHDKLRVLRGIAGIFPLKKSLRLGTPDQKLFVANVLGDRFLQSLAGFVHPARKKLLKTVSRYLSGVVDGYSFLSMENEPFNLQYHERVPGATVSGKIIREMHGFLVVARDSNRVVRLGQVLT